MNINYLKQIYLDTQRDPTNSLFLRDFIVKSNEDSETIEAHRIILALNCEYFQGYFKKEPSSDSVILPYSSSILNKCIEHVYTGDTSVTVENAQDILVVSNYLGIIGLIDKSSSFIENQLDETNVCDILILADDLNSEILIVACVNYIALRFDKRNSEVLSRIYTLPPHVFIRILESDHIVYRTTWDLPVTQNSELIHLKQKEYIQQYIQLYNERDSTTSTLLISDDYFQNVKIVIQY